MRPLARSRSDKEARSRSDKEAGGKSAGIPMPDTFDKITSSSAQVRITFPCPCGQWHNLRDAPSKS
eukprot:5060109-Prymnesium_polylepis.1